MSSFLEHQRIWAAIGPHRSPQEIDTYAYLAEFSANCAQIDGTPMEVRQERVQAVRDALVRQSDAEAARAALWLRAPLSARMVAVMSAKLQKERAHDALNKFDAFDRGSVWVALNRLLGELQTVQKCMVGGRMPERKGRVH
jgi:hypothetical protein